MDGLRIDKWLWYARFCRSRSLARHLLDEGTVSLNNRPVSKISTPVRCGDELLFRQGRIWRRIVVLDVGSRRGPAAEARALYQELIAPDPPPDDWD